MEKVLAIAITTFRESIRSKILYSLLVFAVVVVLLGAFFGSVSIGDQVAVIKDFSLFAISIFSVAFAVISGTALLHKELAKKTIYNLLSKPVTRAQFLWGKFLGLFATASLLVLLMGALLSAFLLIYQGTLDLGFMQAYIYILLEVAIVCGFAIFFSSILVTPLLAGILTFAVFLAGRGAKYILVLIDSQPLPEVVQRLFTGVYWVLPQLSRFAVSDQIVFGQTLPLSHTAACAGYVLGYTLVLLVISGFFFDRKDFN